MEPYNGFSSSRQESPSSLTRRLSWSRPSPLPHDAIAHESMSIVENDDYISQRRVQDSQQDPDRIHSQASDLDSPVYAPGDTDDTVHLTSQDAAWKLGEPYERDIERRRGRRGHGARDGALKAMSKSIKRASIRVVNFANTGLDDRPVRLEDVDGQIEHREELLQRPAVTALRGRTLAVFGPTNRMRLAMYKLLSSTLTESLILFFIIVNAAVLTSQAIRQVFLGTPNGASYFRTWEDFALFGLFIIYTLEAFCRIIVSGLLVDPDIPFSSLSINLSGFKRQGTLTSRISALRPRFQRSSSSLRPTLSRTQVPAPGTGNIAGGVSMWEQGPASGFRSASKLLGHDQHPTATSGSLPSSNTGSRFAFHLQSQDLPFRAAVNKQLDITSTSRPYLRHSWNRVDALAIMSFWVMFLLCIFGQEKTASDHLYIFRAFSVLRTTRLLTITNGTTTILTSLKRAAPQLVNVAFFVFFAIAVFSIVGVHSFQGSYRRSCVIVTDGQQGFQLSQQCGGHIDPNSLSPVGYFTMNNQSTTSPKGFICPLGQVCQESPQNPENNAQSFDNVLAASLQIAILASANGWSGNMYDMMFADYFFSCIFFIIGLVVLNFWLLNLLVAVITQSFKTTRAETNRSAFGAEIDVIPVFEDKDGEWGVPKREQNGTGVLQRWYNVVEPLFVLLALASLTLQAIRSTSTPYNTIHIAFLCEVGITAAFGLEIVWRICATLPAWRSFFSTKQNVADFFLAIICGIILIPPISHSAVYPWLTIFQLMRFYRVILLVPGMKTLLFQVFGNLRGLLNMSIFLLLANFLAALFAIQLIRDDVPTTFNENFQGLVTAFLAMYQLTSSENWENVMWAAANAEYRFKQQVIVILFLVVWLYFANFIMVQMFIAVINENFVVAEEQKRAHQVHAFIQRAEPTATNINWLDRINPYRQMKANPKAVTVEALPSHLVLPLKKSVVREYRAPGESSTVNTQKGITDTRIIQGPLGTMRKFMGMDESLEDVPLTTLKGPRLASQDMDDTERHLEAMNAINHDSIAEDNRDALFEQRAQRAEFISDHPTYDKTLWIFTQSNPIRQFCQRLVPPSNGDHEERIYGIPPSPWLEFGFRALMLVTVIAGIVIASVATPLYRRDYISHHSNNTIAWFDLAETVFGFLLVVEFAIKVIADGFIFTPNAYLLNIWNVLDLIILIAILINVTTSLIIFGGLSRGTRALKAFRALRLITLVGWMRETFHSVIFAGARRIIDAAVLAILYMIPYAVWGLNIFSGRMFTCNDGNALGKDDCQNEYLSSPIDNSLVFLAPRAWEHPNPSTTFSFDSFFDSFLILFEIVSLEGWIDVLNVALNLSGLDLQPSVNVSQVNALFFVLYNLLGAVVILTLFVSIIISNFSNRSGMALLTSEQTQWIDLQKLISRQKPSKRPLHPPKGAFKSWCFHRAVRKRGWWSRGMTFLCCAQIAILMSQTFENSSASAEPRDYVYLGLAACFIADPIVKLIGLGWKSFRANGWNLFDVVVIFGSIATTLAILLGVADFGVRQAQKLFLVCVAFKLMQKLNNLNQLFKTAVSSLSVIAKLFGLWISLFLFFGILWLEVFALTRWETAESANQNYMSLSATLVMMTFMSSGEGWNQFMHDYAVSYPRCTNSSSSLAESDCGSMGWSYFLFITWNILSMYIFVNMFTGVVVENFSYVYEQRGNQTLNREEMRSFKKVWAQFDQSMTGHLERAQLVPFLAKLSGVFEVRIHPTASSFRNIYNNSQADPGEDFVPGAQVGTLDLRKLAKNLSTMDNEEIRRRRKLYNRLYWEASLLSQGDVKGISFQSMLTLLSHYKLIDDEKALKVDEIIRRRAITEQVDDCVNLDKVRSLLKMIYYRKRFMALMEAKRNAHLPQIVVDTALSPPTRTRDITHAHHESFGTELDSPSGRQTSFIAPHTHITPFEQSPTTWSDPASPSTNAYRRSDLSVMSTDPSYDGSPRGRDRRERGVVTVEDRDAMLRNLNSSVWGKMMMDVEADEGAGEGEGEEPWTAR